MDEKKKENENNETFTFHPTIMFYCVLSYPMYVRGCPEITFESSDPTSVLSVI